MLGFIAHSLPKKSSRVAMPHSFSPRLSEARLLLPLLRSQLVAAATLCPLPSGLALDLMPVSEDGLFGYELVPDRATHTYLTIGRNAQGEAVLRKTVYGASAGGALRLVAVDGSLSRSERAEHYRSQQRDARFADWAAVAEAALAQLLVLFPRRPRRPVAVREHAHQCLDEALAVAHGHLARWDPFIRFCGIPNEAEHGFALAGEHGECGWLIFQRPDIWILRWKAPLNAVYESWSVGLADQDAASDLLRGDRAS